MTNAFVLLRLLPMSDRDKDTEILALRHQITVSERQLGNARPRFSPADRAFLAALPHARLLIRDHDGKFPALFDTVLADAGIRVVLSGIRIPRMNAIMERWIHICRHELLDRILIRNQQHLLHARGSAARIGDI
ncbi:hypothetical protein AB0H12_41785 [Actinosynnema sp. NPDC023794]